MEALCLHDVRRRAAVCCRVSGGLPVRYPDAKPQCPDAAARAPGISVPRDRRVFRAVMAQAWPDPARSEEHTSELQSLMRISYAVFCLKKKRIKIDLHLDTS